MFVKCEDGRYQVLSNYARINTIFSNTSNLNPFTLFILLNYTDQIISAVEEEKKRENYHFHDFHFKIDQPRSHVYLMLLKENVNT